MHQGLSFTNLIQGQSDTEVLKRFLRDTGANFDSSIVGTTGEGTVIYDSVIVTEKLSFRTDCFVICSTLSSTVLSSDSFAKELFYLFALFKVHSDRSVNLTYVDFVTHTGKRPNTVIEADSNLVLTMSVNRLLTVKSESALHESFVRRYGHPRVQSNSSSPDPNLDGLRRTMDTLNGKTLHTSIKPKDVPSCLLRTNMLRRLSEHSVLEHIRQTGETIDIQLETAWVRLISMGESWDDDT